MSTICSVMRVLVVDDYPDNAWSMALLLRQDCHEVETALNGATALQAARDNQPDVVLLDISMPGMSGLQVAREMRRMFQDKVTLIAITANGFDEDRAGCFDAGFDHYFVKPADPEKLKRLIRDVATSI